MSRHQNSGTTITDVTAQPLEEVVEPVTYRHTSDDSFAVESKQER